MTQLKQEKSPETSQTDFSVSLTNFSGPFDLLLGLISKRELEITEVSLAQVTDEFIAYMRVQPDLSKATEFLVVAATLLDLKARSLLPTTESDDESDFEYLEARDLLFSRLLQYRAFKEVAGVFAGLWKIHSQAYPREVPLPPDLQKLLPELVWTTTSSQLAQLAAQALTREPPRVTISHLHDVLVPVGPQRELLAQRLRELKACTFKELCADTEDINMIVSRFLALLELFREGQISFAQEAPLAPLNVVWIG
ncbi:segregation/condensation protein A [Gleimia sp. 6138-11-ORH1]|uniref:segregation and condensation protein A n=1 Tax=Gleimia sp. 6138-11-ORH1 TaxID=2973937 RepID=UPI002167D2BA|nr:ScpA family protein [Gleimia sp. 6138-11-ORH1]MCS4484334.1 segregation/condensation protein A [Gleimia sp. 6138-11-ORH1]